VHAAKGCRLQGNGHEQGEDVAAIGQLRAALAQQQQAQRRDGSDHCGGNQAQAGPFDHEQQWHIGQAADGGDAEHAQEEALHVGLAAVAAGLVPMRRHGVGGRPVPSNQRG